MAAPAPASVPGGKPFTLTQASPGVLQAGGALSFATARTARAAGIAMLATAAAGPLQIDCSAVSPADSAGLAVLLEWLGVAKRAGRSLRYTQLPEGLLALARISEADPLLERGV